MDVPIKKKREKKREGVPEGLQRQIKLTDQR
jgi:hypothetical protein